MSFEIKLPLFEGPFDLLLFFIERDELDIHDIPIFRITNDFMDYLRQLEHMNMDIASEFILTAATLMRIKAKMLLPRLEKDEEGNEIDPREELVQHLLEYKRFKAAVHDLELMEEERMKMENRGNIEAEWQQLAQRNSFELDMQDVSLYKLMRVFEKMMVRYEAEAAKPKHTVYTYPYTIEQQKSHILDLVSQRQEVTFTELIREYPDKIGLIFNFLAILDMLQLNLIAIEVGDGFNNFYVRRADGDSTQVTQIIFEE